MTQGAPTLDNRLKDAKPSGEAYAALEVTAYTPPNVDWNDVESQDEEGLWVYDVFTPPQIFWDSEKEELVPKPPVPPPPPPPFGVEFRSIARELYRLQFEGFFAALSGEINDGKIQIYDNRIKRTFRGKVGKTFSKGKFKILSAEEKRDVDSQGMIDRYIVVVIQDLEINKEITFREERKIYLENKQILKFETTNPPYDIQEIVVREKGETFTLGEDTFTLTDFSFDNQTATLKKESPILEEPVEETLSVLSAAAAKEQAKEAEVDNTDTSTGGSPDNFLDFF